MYIRLFFALLLGFIQVNCYYFNTFKLTSQINGNITETALFEQGIVFQNLVWFIGSDQVCTEREPFGCTKILYKSDLTPNGTVAVFTLGTNYSSTTYDEYYILSESTFVLLSEDSITELWGVQVINSTTSVALLARDTADEGIDVIQFGSQIAFLSPITNTSSDRGSATIRVSNGTINGTRDVISYNFYLPYNFDYAACAPSLDVAVGTNHFFYYLPDCNQTNENYNNLHYYISDGTQSGSHFVFNSTFTLQGFSFTSNGTDYFIAIVFTVQAEFIQLYGVNGLIANINLPDTISEIYGFVQIQNDIFFIGEIDTGVTNIYKLIYPFTSAQRWDEGGSSYKFDELNVRNNSSLWVVDILSSTTPPKILQININQSNQLTILYNLPFGTFNCTPDFCGAHYQILSEGLSLYRAQDISQESYRAKLEFLTFSGVDSVLAQFSYGPYGNGISSVSENPIDYHGVLFYTVEYGTVPNGPPSVSYPFISIPCGDGITQFPEVCDDGNNNDGDGCSSDCLSNSTLSTSSSTGSSTGSSTSSSTGSNSCNSGNMKCVSSNSFQTCANNVWGVSQPCAPGTVCASSSNYISCVISSSSSTSSSSTCSDGFMRCATSETFQTCSFGDWSVSQSCAPGTTCHPSTNYISCY